MDDVVILESVLVLFVWDRGLVLYGLVEDLFSRLRIHAR